MTVSGEMRRTRSTKSVTTFAPCTVAVGLFGLLKNTRPAPRALATMPSTSSLPAESTLTSVTGSFHLRAKFVQFSNVGAAVTSCRPGDTNARTALRRISCEPAPSTMFSGLTLCFLAIVSTRSASFGVLLKG